MVTIAKSSISAALVLICKHSQTLYCLSVSALENMISFYFLITFWLWHTHIPIHLQKDKGKKPTPTNLLLDNRKIIAKGFFLFVGFFLCVFFLSFIFLSDIQFRQSPFLKTHTLPSFFHKWTCVYTFTAYHTTSGVSSTPQLLPPLSFLLCFSGFCCLSPGITKSPKPLRRQSNARCI